LPPTRSWLETLRSAIVTNWPVKVTALVLSGVLWAAVAAEEPTTQLIPVHLVVQPPPGRTIQGPLPAVQAVYVGSTRELIKLYSSPPTIRKVLPDTVTGTRYELELSPQDLVIGRQINVRAQDVQPRDIVIQLDEVAHRTVRVEPRVTAVPDSGYAILNGLAVEPSSVTVIGPDSVIRHLSEIPTVAMALTGLKAPVRRTVRLDTAGLGGVRVVPDSVAVSADIAFMAERVLMGVPVTIQGERTGVTVATPPAVIVTVRGPSDRLVRLTRDSVTVIASHSDTDRPETVLLEVLPPDGLTAVATPDSVLLERRTRG
jgi:YbbR domain-containing protein